MIIIVDILECDIREREKNFYNLVQQANDVQNYINSLHKEERKGIFGRKKGKLKRGGRKLACLELLRSLLIVREEPYKFARAATRPPLKLGHDVVVVVVVDEKEGKKKRRGEEKKERGEEPIVRVRTGLAKRRGRAKRRASDRLECLRVSEAPFAEEPFVPSN